MTKDEIKALIANKIANQGNQVDLGGALATILNELVDGMGDGGGVFDLHNVDTDNLTEEQAQAICRASSVIRADIEGEIAPRISTYEGAIKENLEEYTYPDSGVWAMFGDIKMDGGSLDAASIVALMKSVSGRWFMGVYDL